MDNPIPVQLVGKIHVGHGLPVGTGYIVSHGGKNFPLHVSGPAGVDLIAGGVYGLVPMPGADVGVGTDSVSVVKSE